MAFQVLSQKLGWHKERCGKSVGLDFSLVRSLTRKCISEKGVRCLSCLAF